MKVFLVLALAIFSVCDANIPSQEEPEINLRQVKRAFWGYVAGAATATGDMMDQFKKTELGQDVSARITHLNEQVTALKSQDFMIQLSQDAEQLMAGLEKSLSTVVTTVQPVADVLMAKLESEVEAMIPKALSLQRQLTKKTQEVQESAFLYGDRLKTKIDHSYHDFRASKASTHQLFLPTLLMAYLIQL